MKPQAKRWIWSGAKLIAAAVILFFVGRQLLGDLEKLDVDLTNPQSLLSIVRRPGWLFASACLYLLSLLPSVWYWRHLHLQFLYPIDRYAAMRAHYIAQIGKYVPGKALAIWIRASLMHPFGVPYGVSVIISFYEVLTAMAAGGLLAALVYVIDPPIIEEPLVFRDWELDPRWAALVLMGLCGIPLLPGVFNFIIGRMTAHLQAIELYRLPPVRYGTLLTGLLMTSIGWFVQGFSLWAMLQAVLPEPPALTLSWVGQCTAALAFATVLGFVIIVIPGGLGVRESCLSILLNAAGPIPYVVAAAILLRVVWIITECVVAGCFYLIQPSKPQDERSDSRG
jgi:glycosyltransferase 2 family protein